MARIPEVLDLSEFGDVATYLARGWTQELGGGNCFFTIDTGTVFHDIAGNGGSHSVKLRNGNFSANCRIISPTFATPRTSIYPRVHFYVDSLQTLEYQLIGWRHGTTDLGTVALSTTGHLKIYSGGTLLATSANALAVGTWYTLEVGVTIGNSGSYEVRVDGSSVGWVPPASGDTQPGSDTTIDNMFLNIGCGSTFTNGFYDDIQADDAEFCGNFVMTVHVPTGPGNSTQLTPSSGSNWQNVDETPPNDADYNEATSAPAEDTYAHSALSGAAISVKSVGLVTRAVKAGSGIGSVYLLARSGGADYAGPQNLLGTSYAVFSEILEQDPATSAPWTPTGFNNSEIGIRFDA